MKSSKSGLRNFKSFIMGKIKDQLQQKGVLISDGALGTMLQAKGLQAGECPELWNLERPDDVCDVAKSYVEAGSNLFLTNTFGGNRFKLDGYGLSDKAFEINKAGAELARKAAGNDAFVLGSIGPTGKMLMMGEVSEEDLYEAFKTQAKALEAGGADGIIVETMSDLEEAAIAVRSAKDNTALEVICTMTFEKTKEGNYYSMMGVAPHDAVERLIDEGAEIIGANCGNGTEGMIEIVKEIRSVNKDVPVLIHANAGLPVYEDGETVFPESPDEMSSLIPKLIDAGANIVGGCCGTTPDHIRKIAAIAKNH